MQDVAGRLPEGWGCLRPLNAQSLLLSLATAIIPVVKKERRGNGVTCGYRAQSLSETELA
jgi:hypothetical protein